MTNITRLSQEPPSSAIDEAEVTAGKLASILSSAVIDNVIDENGNIYATEGLDFPIWVSIDTERKFLCLFTYLEPAELADFPLDVVLPVVNALNQNHIVAQYHWDDGKIIAHFWMTFDSGLNPRQFVKMLRRFSGVFANGAKDLLNALKSDPV